MVSGTNTLDTELQPKWKKSKEGTRNRAEEEGADFEMGGGVEEAQIETCTPSNAFSRESGRRTLSAWKQSLL